MCTCSWTLDAADALRNDEYFPKEDADGASLARLVSKLQN
mgnify:FL=1